MPEIIGKDGRVLQRSRNLRGIRRAVGEVLVSTVAVRRIDRPGWSGATTARASAWSGRAIPSLWTSSGGGGTCTGPRSS